MHRLAKATYRISRYRGFESPPLRQLSPLESWAHRGAARRIMTRAPTKTLLLLLAATGAACRSPGPELTMQNPGGDVVFLDGKRVLDGDAPDAEPARALPFRYYGVTRWDVLPNIEERNGVPLFDRGPQSAEVELAPPASPWLFPFDFPLEALDRLIYGRRDVTVEAIAAPKQRIEGAIPQDELGKLSARARAARSKR